MSGFVDRLIGQRTGDELLNGDAELHRIMPRLNAASIAFAVKLGQDTPAKVEDT